MPKCPEKRTRTFSSATNVFGTGIENSGSVFMRNWLAKDALLRVRMLRQCWLKFNKTSLKVDLRREGFVQL